MRILTRYILREVTALALIGVAIFTFVLFTRDLGRILELVVRASAPLPSVAEIFFFTVPLALTYTLPMSVLLGILIGLSRLAADSEITAMRASGMGIWTFLRALSTFVAAAWLMAMVNGLYIAPRAQAALGHLEDRLKGSQVSFEIQPRVFYEGFPKKVLYVQDVKTAQGAAVWKGVFMADLSDATNPTITLAKEAIVVSEGQDRLHLHLIDGSEHVTDPKDTGHYQISTFQQTDIPLDLPSTENKPDESLPAEVMNTAALWQKAGRVDPISARWYLIAFHRRFALPTACLVLALVGIPLGLSSKKSGKSGGFVLTILLGFAFLGIKAVEYAEKFEKHHVPGPSFSFVEPVPGHPDLMANPYHAQIYFSLYFVMTGLHALHMIIGIGFFVWLLIASWKGRFTPAYNTPLEMGGLYWHFVDIVWIYLFPLLYLIDLRK